MRERNEYFTLGLRAAGRSRSRVPAGVAASQGCEWCWREERLPLSPELSKRQSRGLGSFVFIHHFLCSLYLKSMRGLTAPVGPRSPLLRREMEVAEIPRLSAFLRRGAMAKGFLPWQRLPSRGTGAAFLGGTAWVSRLFPTKI